ncbi:putative quinol monooxygenase [Thalassospira lucentensis]|uniref:putative quinol monooxygenase n=1 Tax=Thalassospira lucentensis TaxID=168935 RepID=UPI00399D6C2D|tara:strand:+ start:12066 stop:12395 length:330 start_codon:yes stop_codon:yes gene_type:complete
MSDPHQTPTDEIITISQVTPKPGQYDAFVTLQTAFQTRVAPEIDGLLGGRLFLGDDGKTLVIMSRFRSRADLNNWTSSPRFAEHMLRVQPMIEPANPGRFTVLYQSGNV